MKRVNNAHGYKLCRSTLERQISDPLLWTVFPLIFAIVWIMFPKGLSTEDSAFSQMVLLWVAGTFRRRSLDLGDQQHALRGILILGPLFSSFPFCFLVTMRWAALSTTISIIKYGLVTGPKPTGSQPLTEKLETKNQNKSSILTNWLSMVFKMDSGDQTQTARHSLHAPLPAEPSPQSDFRNFVLVMDNWRLRLFLVFV